MEIIKPQFEIWEQQPGEQGICEQIERCGRVCYKSEGHKTADSARPFVERMIKSQHTAMLEHGTVYLTLPMTKADGEPGCVYNKVAIDAGNAFSRNPFSHVNMDENAYYVTTNLRVLVENDWMALLSYLTEPTALHDRRVTVHFTTQVAITREFNRHRANSIAEQSTRYCNYSKDKFGGQIGINLPSWVASSQADDATGLPHTGSADDFLALATKVADGSANDLENWLFANMAAERAYMNLIAAGRKPQEARVVLPLDTNTELVHTAFTSDWKHFFDLRALGTTGAPHPDAKALAQPLYEAFVEKGYIRKA